MFNWLLVRNLSVSGERYDNQVKKNRRTFFFGPPKQRMEKGKGSSSWDDSGSKTTSSHSVLHPWLADCSLSPSSLTFSTQRGFNSVLVQRAGVC